MKISPAHEGPGFRHAARSEGWRCRTCHSRNGGKAGSERLEPCATSRGSARSGNRRCRAPARLLSRSSSPQLRAISKRQRDSKSSVPLARDVPANRIRTEPSVFFRQSRRQLGHDAPPFLIAHLRPACDFVQCAAATRAAAAARFVSADFHARRFHAVLPIGHNLRTPVAKR
jgi:hypothetical protein